MNELSTYKRTTEWNKDIIRVNAWEIKIADITIPNTEINTKWDTVWYTNLNQLIINSSLNKSAAIRTILETSKNNWIDLLVINWPDEKEEILKLFSASPLVSEILWWSEDSVCSIRI